MSATKVCEICNGSKMVPILNIWELQETARDVGKDAAFAGLSDALNSGEGSMFIPGPCPECIGTAELDAFMADLQERKGGNPWDPKTFEKTVQ